MALPIWLASELWVEEEDILENEEAKQLKQLSSQKSKKRKGVGGDNVDSGRRKRPRILADSEMSKEMAERREKLRQQKREARKEADGKAVISRADTTEAVTGDKLKVRSKISEAVVASA